jgi:hypothetical protein
MYSRAGSGASLPNRDVAACSYVRMHSRSQRSWVNLLTRSPCDGVPEGEDNALPWRRVGIKLPPLETRRLSCGGGVGAVRPAEEGCSCVCKPRE